MTINERLAPPLTDQDLFELCKEVYKRTGWEDKQLKWLIKGIVTNNPYGEKVSPAYTSDYLLEKLASAIESLDLYIARNFARGWYVSPSDTETNFGRVDGKDLRILSLKLTIALDDAGVKL